VVGIHLSPRVHDGIDLSKLMVNLAEHPNEFHQLSFSFRELLLRTVNLPLENQGQTALLGDDRMCGPVQILDFIGNSALGH
jgi:hypothetical protein